MKYLQFPGCALLSTGRSYAESMAAVCQTLGLDVEDIRDWNCCGATAYMAVDEMKAFALAARNLALAEAQAAEGDNSPQESVPIIAPCAACYLGLTKAQHYIDDFDDVGSCIKESLESVGLTYHGTAKVRHPLDVFVNDVGLDSITERVQKPLKDLRVACYYGCQIVRPYSTFDDQKNPRSMDRLVTALGATPVDWALRTRCCGGSHTGTIPEVGLRLNHILLTEAKEHGADMIVTACPLCQFNLECFQADIAEAYGNGEPLPVAYFTQLMGMAFGLEDRAIGMHRQFEPFTIPVTNAKEAAHVGA